MTKRIEIQDKDEWLYFAENFLKLAIVGCKEMQNSKHLGSPSRRANEKRTAAIKSLYIPTIYNLKHGLELVVKYLKLIYGQGPESSTVEFAHDLRYLLAPLKKTFTAARIKSMEASNASFAISIGQVDTLFTKTEIDKTLLGFFQIVEKYHHLDFVGDNARQKARFADVANDAFKYPVSTLETQLNYKIIREQVSVQDIKVLNLDIREAALALRYLNLAYVTGRFVDKRA